MVLMWMPAQTTVPPLCTPSSAAGTSEPTGAKMMAVYPLRTLSRERGEGGASKGAVLDDYWKRTVWAPATLLCDVGWAS